MRTLMFCTLAVMGIAIFTDDASAFGRKRRERHECGCESGYGAGYGHAHGYAATGCAGCGATGVAYDGNGVYRAGYNGYTQGVYPGYVYPAGYNPQMMPGAGYQPQYTPGVNPAGGVRPGENIPAQGRTIPVPMPDK
jgi:hypothetical protein